MRWEAGQRGLWRRERPSDWAISVFPQEGPCVWGSRVTLGHSYIRGNVGREESLSATWNMISYKVSLLEGGQKGQQAHLQSPLRAETNVKEALVRKLGSNPNSASKPAVTLGDSLNPSLPLSSSVKYKKI